MQAHDGLAHARYSGHHRRAAEEIAAIDQGVEPGNAGRHPCRCIECGSPVAARRSRCLDAPVHLDSLAVDYPHRVAAHLEVVSARLHDLNRASRRALDVFLPEPDARIRDRFLEPRGKFPFHQHLRIEGQHRRQAFALQALDQDVKRLTGILHRIGGEQGAGAVDENPPGADLVRFLQEQAVRLLHFLPEDIARGIDDFQFLAFFQGRKIPAEPGRVARQLVGRDFEHHDDAGLAELRDAAIDEFHADRRFSGADRAFDQDDVPARNAAGQDLVKPADAGFDALGIG